MGISAKSPHFFIILVGPLKHGIINSYKNMKSSATKIFLILILIFSAVISANSRASIITWKKDYDGVTFTLDKGLLKVKVCSDNIVEVKFTILSSFAARNSLVINNEWKTALKFSVS